MGTGPCRPAVTGPSASPVRKRSTQSPRIPTHPCAIAARARDISSSLPNHRPTMRLTTVSDHVILPGALPGEYQTIADSHPPLQHPVCNELPDPPKNLSSLKRARNIEEKGPFGVVDPLESVRGSGGCFEGACAACGLRRAPDDDDSEEREQHASTEVVREEPEHRRVPGRGSRRLTTVETGASACRRSAGGCDRRRAELKSVFSLLYMKSTLLSLCGVYSYFHGNTVRIKHVLTQRGVHGTSRITRRAASLASRTA